MLSISFHVQAIDILELPSGSVRDLLLELLDVLEGRKKVVGPGGGGTGKAREGHVIALDREKMAADGVTVVDGQLVKQDTVRGGVASAVAEQSQADATTLPAPTRDDEGEEKTEEEQEVVPKPEQEQEQVEAEVEGGDSSDEELMGMD